MTSAAPKDHNCADWMIPTGRDTSECLQCMGRKPAKYGSRNVPNMIRQIDDLRKAIRAEGTPAIQAAWDAVEEHIDYAYRR